MIVWPVELVESKYSRWYDSLIARAKDRKLEGYTEKHHIIPRSFGGSDNKDNLVKLTAREHYIAHFLLWKMKFPGAYHSKMAFAFNTFMNKMTTEVRGVHHTYRISGRLYEKFRKEYSRLLKEKYAVEGGTWVGRKHTEESKRKIGEKSKLKEFKRGPDNPNWGKKRNLSPEEKAKRSASGKAKWEDPEFRAKMTESRQAFFQSPEGIAQRKAHSERVKGVKRDPAIMEKCASAKRGKKEHEIYSPEAILKRKEALKNRVISPEGKARMRETAREVGSRPKSDSFKQKMSQRMTGIQRPKYKCIHCGFEAVLSNINRWHNDNCKKK